jgi:hypothetical protein
MNLTAITILIDAEADIIEVVADGITAATGDITELPDGSLAADMESDVHRLPASVYDEDGELSISVTAADHRSLGIAAAEWWKAVQIELELEREQQEQDAYAEECAVMERWLQDDDDQVEG